MSAHQTPDTGRRGQNPKPDQNDPKQRTDDRNNPKQQGKTGDKPGDEEEE